MVNIPYMDAMGLETDLIFFGPSVCDLFIMNFQSYLEDGLPVSKWVATMVSKSYVNAL